MVATVKRFFMRRGSEEIYKTHVKAFHSIILNRKYLQHFHFLASEIYFVSLLTHRDLHFISHRNLTIPIHQRNLKLNKYYKLNQLFFCAISLQFSLLNGFASNPLYNATNQLFLLDKQHGIM